MSGFDLRYLLGNADVGLRLGVVVLHAGCTLRECLLLMELQQ